MVTMLDYEVEESEFKFRSCYYIHFQIKTFGEDMNPLSPPAMG